MGFSLLAAVASLLISDIGMHRYSLQRHSLRGEEYCYSHADTFLFVRKHNLFHESRP